jgi:hypothetical protein
MTGLEKEGIHFIKYTGVRQGNITGHEKDVRTVYDREES